jgi:NADH-quinone oxidoreductase subunit G
LHSKLLFFLNITQALINLKIKKTINTQDKNTDNDKMVTIEINGKTYQAEAGKMLIEVADANGIHIPRFCYHKKLSIAANCRMCLVEVEKAPKPLPACATPVTAGMKVWTQSETALVAQKAVMEFLLINHPLDCPICDQGGECELQDIAMGYGKGVSRYQESKRVVFDHDLGPLIATDMTRCIHCTRCVRFSQEISGVPEMGASGRGEHTQIGTYIAKNLTSELSGNMIDLCPVGALTAKPFRFTARAWEIQQYEAIAPHDAIGSNLYLHVRRNQIMRVVPKENEAINETWLCDRDRFSYQGLTAPDRLTTPLIKQYDRWQNATWEQALSIIVTRLTEVSQVYTANAIGALITPTATLEELYLLQKYLRGLGCANIDHRLRQVDFSDQQEAPLYPYLGQTITELEHNDAVLIIGSQLPKVQPLLNHRLRKAALRGAKISVINPTDCQFNYSMASELVVAPDEMVENLAAIAQVLLEMKQGTLIPAPVISLIKEITATKENLIEKHHRTLVENLRWGQKHTVLIGELATAHPQLAMIRTLAAVIAKMIGGQLGYLGEAGNSAGAWLAGALPHRQAGGAAVDTVGLDAQAMLSSHTSGLKAYLLWGIEPELDSWYGGEVISTLKAADFVVSFSAYRTPIIESYAQVILPIALMGETAGTYVNIAGQWQTVTSAITPPGETRPGWKILRVLANLHKLAGFEYQKLAQITQEVRQSCELEKVNNRVGWQVPTSYNKLNGSVDGSGLRRLIEMPNYYSDALVRRAHSLQARSASLTLTQKAD